MNAGVILVNLSIGDSFREVSEAREQGYEVAQRNIVINSIGEIIAVYWMEYPREVKEDVQTHININVHGNDLGGIDSANRELKRRSAGIKLSTTTPSIRDAAPADKLQQSSVGAAVSDANVPGADTTL